MNRCLPLLLNHSLRVITHFQTMAPKWVPKSKYGGPKPKPKPKPPATPQPPPGGVYFVMVASQPSAQPPPLRAPEPQHSACVLATAPVDSGAPQGA